LAQDHFSTSAGKQDVGLIRAWEIFRDELAFVWNNTDIPKPPR